MGRIDNMMSRIKEFLSGPPKMFYEGQEITPREKPYWTGVDTGKPGIGPKHNEIVKVKGYESLHEGRWVIWITGYSDRFFEDNFVPVISDRELEGMLEEVNQMELS